MIIIKFIIIYLTIVKTISILYYFIINDRQKITMNKIYKYDLLFLY